MGGLQGYKISAQIDTKLNTQAIIMPIKKYSNKISKHQNQARFLGWQYSVHTGHIPIGEGNTL